MLENINLIFLLYWVQVPLSASSNGPNAGDGQVQQTRWWHLMENTCKKSRKQLIWAHGKPTLGQVYPEGLWEGPMVKQGEEEGKAERSCYRLTTAPFPILFACQYLSY